MSVSDKLAIKESGLAHLELMLNSTVYIEQMALVTGVNELSARDEIKKPSTGQFSRFSRYFPTLRVEDRQWQTGHSAELNLRADCGRSITN